MILEQMKMLAFGAIMILLIFAMASALTGCSYRLFRDGHHVVE